jgi:3-phenylpropionate/cinnamic acid dioxygenase small subunit
LNRSEEGMTVDSVSENVVWPDRVAREVRDDVADFIHLENALLDDRRLEEWLELFAPDGLLWVPGRRNADPARHVSIIYDDLPRLRTRVTRLLSGKEYAQDPPSQTLRQVTNLRCRRDDAGLVVASAVMVVYETRALAAALLVLPCRALYRLRPADPLSGESGRSGGGVGSLASSAPYRIVEKRLDLLETHRHFETLSFLL